MLSVVVFIPTYNASTLLHETLNNIFSQKNQHCSHCIVDSGSTDETVAIALQFDVRVRSISSAEFDHGATRNLIKEYYPDADIYVFLTQDAILATADALSCLLACFSDPSVAAVCGRQLPHLDANPLASHARLFNYPAQSCIKSLADIPELGLKTAFMSNSFAAYRGEVFRQLGGFSERTIFAEDMYLAARLLLAGYKIAYCAQAAVYHSHNYSLAQEFRRYFDAGVFHATFPWIKHSFGGAGGEGFRFVISEWQYLLERAPSWIPRALLATLVKWSGFQLGLVFRILPRRWCRCCSMNKAYWRR